MSAMHDFTLTITNVDMPLFAGAVKSVSVPGTEGVMTILAHHESLVSLLKAGDVIVENQEGERLTFPITDGVLEVSNNQAIILV